MLEVLVAEAVAGGADALGIAGGDGSLAVVAAAARAHTLPFVCIPAWHAQSLRARTSASIAAICWARSTHSPMVSSAGSTLRRRTGASSWTTSSLGIYGDAVQRPGYRDGEAANAARNRARRARSEPSRLTAAHRGRPGPSTTTSLRSSCVSNNPYALDLPLVTGSRPTLTSGRLGILVLDPPGDPDAGRDGRGPPTSVEIRAPEPLSGGIDGEAVELDPPLELVIRPAALRVRISSRHRGVSPSGLLMS